MNLSLKSGVFLDQVLLNTQYSQCVQPVAPYSILQRKDLILFSVLKHSSPSADVTGFLMFRCVHFSFSENVSWSLFSFSILKSDIAECNPANSAPVYNTFSFSLHISGECLIAMSSCFWGRLSLNCRKSTGSISSNDTKCCACSKWAFDCSIITSQHCATILTRRQPTASCAALLQLQLWMWRCGICGQLVLQFTDGAEKPLQGLSALRASVVCFWRMLYKISTSMKTR